MVLHIIIEQVSTKVSTPCHLWQGRVDAKGYGMYEGEMSCRVHRDIYQKQYGPLAADIDVHHVCEVTNCCNIDHLEAVPHNEHPLGRQGQWQKAKTHCPKNHEYTEANTMWEPRKEGFVRACRTCKTAAKRRWEAENRDMVREQYKRANAKRRHTPEYKAQQAAAQARHRARKKAALSESQPE